MFQSEFPGVMVRLAQVPSVGHHHAVFPPFFPHDLTGVLQVVVGTHRLAFHPDRLRIHPQIFRVSLHHFRFHEPIAHRAAGQKEEPHLTGLPKLRRPLYPGLQDPGRRSVRLRRIAADHRAVVHTSLPTGLGPAKLQGKYNKVHQPRDRHSRPQPIYVPHLFSPSLTHRLFSSFLLLCAKCAGCRSPGLPHILTQFILSFSPDLRSPP